MTQPPVPGLPEGRAELPDLRLGGLAVGAWLSALSVLYGGTRVGVALAAGAGLAAAVVAGWLARRPAPGPAHVGLAVLSVLLGVFCGAAATAARVAVRDAPTLTEMAAHHTSVRAELTVRDDPQLVRGDPVRPPLYAVTADLHRLAPLDQPAVRVDVRVLVLASDPAWRSLLPGQPLTATGWLAPPHGGDLRAATISATGPPERAGRPPWHQRAAGALREGLQRACAPLPDTPGGLLPGLVVGDTSLLDPAVVDDFRATGMTHLVAVSGSNLAIVGGVALLLARWCRAGPRLAAASSVLALVGFVILARPSPSVLRAAVMGGLGLVALASARHRAAMPALCAAVAVLVFVDPELAADAGFALSVLATGGLLLLAPRWRDGLRQRGVPRGLAEALAVPAAAQVACAPIIAALSGTVSLVAVPANLLAVPAVAPATVLGVTAAVLSPWWPAAAEVVAWFAQWPARWLVAVAGYSADVPAGAIPWLPGAIGGLMLAVVLLAMLLAVRRPVVRRIVAVVAIAVVIGALPVRLLAGGWPPAGWVVVACAVGQGDALVVPVAPGRAVVVDAGPDPTAVDRCLGGLGVSSVPLLVVTHFHADHVGGVAGVFRGRTVGAIVTSAWPEPASGRSLVRETAQAHGVAVSEASVGWTYVEGPVRLSVLGPVGPLHGTRSDPNNNSLVMHVGVRGIGLLLTGDAETEEQAALLSARGPSGLRADVMKVAHHGSTYQDPAFLDAVDARVALVSVGADNPYGHPNPAVLARLAGGGARVLRTDRDGDAAAVLTESGLAVATARPP